MNQVAVLSPDEMQAMVRNAVRAELGAMVREAAMPKAAFSPVEAAEYLNMSEQTLRSWRSEGKGPAYVTLGRSIMYLKKDLDAFFESNRKFTSGAPDAQRF